MPAPDVWGTAEVLKHLDVSNERLRQLRKPVAGRVAFPEARQLGCGPVWDAREVCAWNMDRKTGEVLHLLVQTRESVPVDRAAKAAGMSPTTARRRLADIESCVAASFS